MADTAARRPGMRDGLFWGLTGALFAAIMGGAIGFVFAEFYGAGWRSGAALGVAVFVVAGFLLARSASDANLPAPNTLKPPVAPPGGAFRAPPGGAFRAPNAPAPTTEAWSAAPAPAQTPTPVTSFADMGEAAGQSVSDVVSRAAYSASAAVTSAAQAARAAIADVIEPAAAPAVEHAEPTRPAGLSAAREGGPDDLKRIKGVGPKLEDLLHSLGFYHFDQVAAWGPSELAWVDSNLEGFNGRATRDDWVGQAKLLAAGGETEFSQRVDKGEVY